MTWAKRLFIGAASVLVVLAAVPGFLLGTETGLQIIKGALEKAVPGLKIESLSGSAFSLKADKLQYTAPGLTFRGNVSWSLNASKLLSRRVDLNAFELSEATLRIRMQEMASSASTPPPEPTTQPTDKAQTSQLKTPVAVIVDRVTIKNLQADIDGNLVNVGLLQTQAVWTQSRIDIDSVLLRDSSFQSAETPPSDESIGSALKRTFSEVIVPTIPAIELPLDLNLKRFELSNFTIKGNPDQTVDSVTFALTAQNGAVALENIAARTMGAELTGAVTLGLDARHEMTLDLNLSTLVAREASRQRLSALPPSSENPCGQITFREKSPQAIASPTARGSTLADPTTDDALSMRFSHESQSQVRASRATRTLSIVTTPSSACSDPQWSSSA